MSSKLMSEELFADKKTGFFIYLFVEAIMFTTLFATYLIYTPPQTGPYPGELFEWQTTLFASLFLISSSGTLLLSEKGLKERKMKLIVAGVVITFLLGAGFMYFEIEEFRKFITDGHVVSTNNFLSAYYVLVGLHAVHVTFGLGWMIVLLVQGRLLPFNLFKEKHKIFNYYWHFVDAIWIIILLVVYIPYLF
ncbi:MULTISPECIES: cytochrome c oxidase subunit 3 [Salimicrobium]|uniref:Cytochrome c oxidase subunit 3/cytochrome aa3-600 menaquinol oxidase subunit 3 n=2 Tax=Salimicrobium TaxID=351195 RepID=A0ABY1KXJ5_9BACI|nr:MULTISPECIES: cytochrome c oxidase subunit 3 [Salimicrobium]SDY10993.1 cytochrome c oxidase subunit 3 [Salimicrobium album]SIS75605.1 cytochrome c oxidase subunit 3/cytochrome aa3-600 menaquinol oxidase subunit 3 [Salimicrobium salexigens]